MTMTMIECERNANKQYVIAAVDSQSPSWILKLGAGKFYDGPCTPSGLTDAAGPLELWQTVCDPRFCTGQK